MYHDTTMHTEDGSYKTKALTGEDRLPLKELLHLQRLLLHLVALHHLDGGLVRVREVGHLAPDRKYLYPIHRIYTIDYIKK